MADQSLTKETILVTAEQVHRRFGPEKTSVVNVARALNASSWNHLSELPKQSIFVKLLLKDGCTVL
ncbi:hypothetical protein [Metabacillus sp. RGM 3146]|uniref:hypothetical protein n=1 Tax=Metabacillus sp. RGM 3146 TaxID=3401092 RepID=UPI003B9AE122